MSRLDSAIRRLAAQRDCIDAAARALAGRKGCVLELGLGNGRTYDHLRLRFPDNAIYVFDRVVRAHPDCRPDEAHMFLGDFFDTLPQAAARLGSTAILAHCDFGSGQPEIDAEVAARLSAALAPVLAPQALVLSDQPLRHRDWRPVPLPETVAKQRYYIFETAA